MECLDRRYRLIKRLAQRDGVQVDLTQDRLLGGVAVLKCAPREHPAAVGLWTEASWLGSLGHPRLVRLLDRFGGQPWEEGGTPLVGLALRWVDGDPLPRVSAGLPLEERVALFWGLVHVVGYLHHRGLLHLDVKPSNVLATREGGAVLLDLGSARPVDSGPGEAGGTLGYAAPEVVLGQAASVASDLYSLGALLYELLAGAPPFGQTDVHALREACLSGVLLPLRAVAPEVPRPLASLVMDLLQLEPQRRPHSVRELALRLAEAGFPSPPSPVGLPPLIGRSDAVRRLGEALAEGPGQQRVCGRPQSGRDRVVREALGQQAEAGLRVVDLTGAERPVAALHRLLGLRLKDLPPLGVPAGQALLAGLPAAPEPQGVLYLGRLEELPEEDARAAEQLLPLAAQLGWTTLVASSRWSSGQRVMHLAPLDDDGLLAIARFAGVVGMEADRLVGRADGLPGQLMRELTGAQADAGALGAEARACWEVLSSLPPGVPPAARRALPSALRAGLDALTLHGLARLDQHGLLLLEGAPPPGPVDRRVAPQMRALLESGERLDPLWAALTALGLGWVERATELLPEAERAAQGRRAELARLVLGLAGVGCREAALILARLRLADGDHDGALAALATLGDWTLGDDSALLGLRVLRMAGRLAEGERQARALVEQRGLPAARLELAHCLTQRGAYDEAEQEVEQALAQDPALAEGEGLVVRMILSARRASLGEPVPQLDSLLAQLNQQGAYGRIGSASLMAAARVLSTAGDLDRAQRLLEAAVASADREGDLRLAAAARLNRGNLLLRLERGREARRAYSESLALARVIRQPALVVRLCYSLASLELRSGRIPDAQAYIAEFRQISEGLGDPEASVRGRLLNARLLALTGQNAEALAELDQMAEARLPEDLLVERALVLARVLLDLGHPDRAQQVLDTVPPWGAASNRRSALVLRGRAHLAQGRAALAEALTLGPAEPDPMQRLEVGELLLSWAGEDLDPASFGERRRALDQAARLLTGEPASRAATLRDRILTGPSAALDGVVELTEAMHDPKAFPAALARLVGQAMGANRVLILLRIPGLGQQVTWRELAGEEAAGIGEEVLRRIQRPEDVWTSDDAYDDPRLREVSATVRNFRIRSLLAVAIPCEGRAVGALYLDDLHRAHRFGPDDVAALRRLAAAAGRMVALLPTGARRVSTEPRQILGVWLSDPEQIGALEDTLALMRDQRQTNLLITGETGVGKTWFARRVAQEVLGLDDVEELVVRRMDPQMLVSTLSGTRRGEFTGAITQTGAIQRAIASRRALFLDEVQSLDEAGQQILLPLLELPLRRFGGLMGATHPVEGPLHILLGTNEDVSGQGWARHFRSDLWFRMSQVHVHLPTLAERGAEVTYRYLAQLLAEEGLAAPEQVLEMRALAWVTHHRWPGNLRQLRTFATHAAHLRRQRGQPLGLAELRRLGLEVEELGEEADDRSELSVAERDLVVQALQKHGWVQADAARALGITKWRILRLVRKYELNDLIRRMRGSAEGEEGP